MAPSNANGEPPAPKEASPMLNSSSSRAAAENSTSQRPNVTKAVSIADPEIESISPLMQGRHKELDSNDYFDLGQAAKRFRASVNGKRLSGRPSIEPNKALIAEGNPSLSSLLSDSSDAATPRHHSHENLVKQVAAWLKNEKNRRAARKAKRKAKHAHGPSNSTSAGESAIGDSAQSSAIQERRESESSDGSAALEQLASILERTLSIKSAEGSPRHHKHSHGHGRKLSSLFKRHSTISSGEDHFDSIDQLVPSCEAVLDNSNTMAYGAGGPDSESTTDLTGKAAARRAKKEKEAWATFKYEIVRLTHTLKLKGWRRVPLDMSGEISVDRLSGALTNAVYVVSPPKELPHTPREDGLPAPKNPPPKLLLRIYGPQVEHLIDREAELQILRRLARKRIGPRLLGTFSNGRFEEYFHARALTPQELRMPDTSKQIAKRMRELHEGIDLLNKERDAGPFVWQSWDKWLPRVEQIVTWLDGQIINGVQGEVQSPSEKWKDRGLVCGVQWPIFKAVVEKYRAWLEEQYGGLSKLNERLVFSHNDTQYGNILRMTPSGESPLLLPANEHKQLIVIDFEYANANLPGFEFANHFTEWCYNYHDPIPYRCNTSFYPTPEEQQRFIRAYLQHTPSFKAPGGSASNPATPYLGPLHSSGSSTALAATAAPTSISAFMLDSRAPPGDRHSYSEQEALNERKVEEESRRLMAETRLWRVACSAFWIAWGMVQARIPGMPDFDSKEADESGAAENAAVLDSATKEVGDEAHTEDKQSEVSATTSESVNDRDEPSRADVLDKQDAEDDEEEFDYLGYAQERAMFFWGDAITLGLVKAEELPEEVRKRVKKVEY